ncbi:MAG: PQQ-binding-like beta-propeller repeat protein, partial [Planctomycetes bacterium]|nr:PQQ-binding-like beta-propeller repeat protein [Planctomycetota bacterium]
MPRAPRRLCPSRIAPSCAVQPLAALACWILLLSPAARAAAGDQPQWGERFTRNMVSDEKGLPDSFDPDSGKNVRWAIEIGTNTYSTPVVSAGRVFIGTNNSRKRNPLLGGDRGVLLCLDETDGRFIWQLALLKRGPSPFWDWPMCGMVSPATVEGDRVYMVTNRGEVVALDLEGMKNGNGGPFGDERSLLAAKDGDPIEPGATDADILWLYDLTKEAGVRQHDSAHSSILVHGRFLYVNTSNGLDDEHTRVVNPEAPSLVVFDR